MDNKHELDNYGRLKEHLSKRRNNILSGKANCIPFGLPRFEQIVPGIQQGKFTLVTASTKVGKTKVTDNLFMYNPIK
jgi:replicative DNA helicase|tara:strand:+ start:4150 stop:4380 length:231 start_codon:yes stop_codon:yes gene_type:complete